MANPQIKALCPRINYFWLVLHNLLNTEGAAASAAAASAVRGAGGDVSAVRGADPFIVNGLDLDMGQTMISFYEQGTVSTEAMVKAVWSHVGAEEMEDPGWFAPRPARPRRWQSGHYMYEDVFAYASFDMPFQLMNTSNDAHWMDASGHKM